MRRSLYAIVAAVAVFSGALVVASCGTATGAANETPPSPLAASSPPPPAWVIAAARRQAEDSGDPHPRAAYWGLLHDPELGDLTDSGPDDPSHSAYAIVLVGYFPKVLQMASHPYGASLPVPNFVYVIYDKVTHEDAGDWGFGPSFDPSHYPSLKRFELE